jgi:hypothetical protein
MYEGDTFFNLTILGRSGLVALSITLFVVTMTAFYVIAKRISLVTRIVTAMVFLWAFIWLSPQIYYLYYIFLFEGLPLQNVIHQPPNAQEILSIMTFTSDAWLSAHAKAVLGWAMILLSFWLARKPPTLK